MKDIGISPEDLFVRILTFFSGSKRYFTADTPLGDVVNDEFEERNLWLAVTALELTVGVDIPEEMVNLGRLSARTVGEFAASAANLPKVNDYLYIARFVNAVVGSADPLADEDEVHRQEDDQL